MKIKLFVRGILRNRSNSGSTIIELLIAVMVVGLIITAVANAVTYSIKHTAESRYRQAGAILGQQVIEYIRSEKNRMGLLNLKNTLVSGTYCFSLLPDTLDTTPTQGACGPNNTVSMAGTNFYRNVEVVTATSAPYKILVTVTTSWTDGNQTRSVELVQEFEDTN